MKLVLDVVDSQKAYYDARAPEYERSLDFCDGRFGAANPEGSSLTRIQRFVRALPVVESTVELGCGTGIWTRELSTISRSVHAVDSSPRMIDLNQAQGYQGTVTFECADVFNWRIPRLFDRVAAAFFLSHVPGTLLEYFVGTIDRLTSQAGSLLIIDETMPDRGTSSGVEARRLIDGSVFDIVKVYRTRDQLRAAFKRCYPRVKLEVEAGRFLAILLSR